MAGKPEPLWRNPAAGTTPMDRYRRHVNGRFNLRLQNSRELHGWSVRRPHDFWIDLHSYLGVVPPLPERITEAYDERLRMRDVPPFFPGYELNYAENVLRGRQENGLALVGLREGGPLEGYQKLTWGELAESVREARSALLKHGIERGDRVAAWMSNCPYTIVLFLASATIGAVFSSISPDMGPEGTLSRLRQITPSILFADSHATYKGQRRPMEEKLKTVVEGLRPAKSLVFVVPVSDGITSAFPLLRRFLAKADPEDALEYARLPFAHPLYILYSSGTSGPPKCIVHQHGTILQFKKIAILHNSMGPDSIVMQYSSTSWVLWNVMNGHLSVGAAVICYDGSPLWPDPTTLLKILEHHRATYFGTSPRYLQELQATGIIPRSAFDLSALRMVTTTGATLAADQFLWFYRHAFPPSVHLSSVAGGTDIATSWLASDPAGPVYAGEMQAPALGMDVDVADAETGESIKQTGRAGELVCRTPFPSMPLGFWGDDDGSAYRAAYFERFGDVDAWAQHDWLSMNPATGGFVMTGRSDGVLNPSGVRFGSAEVYSIVEGPRFNGKIADTLCVGRRRPGDRDEQVFLFVKMRPGHAFADALARELKAAIRDGLSARHVPSFVVEVPDIPVTINGKKVEIAVKQIISGKKDVKVSSTVANPEVLGLYRGFEHLERAVPASKL